MSSTPTPAPATVVHLVRHGEVYNPDRILYGRLPNFRLSARGENQAARTAEAFRGHDVAFLGCSPLARARQSAAPISEILGLEPEADERLIESGNSFEGKRTKGLRSVLWRPSSWPLLKDPSVPSWGEPYAEIAERMFAAIAQARARAEGREAVLVSHQLPIVTVQRTLRGQRLAHNPQSRRCALASVTSVVYRGEEVVDLRYAEPAQEV